MTEARKTLLRAKSLSEVKKETWKIFSEYVRKRDCGRTNGYGMCVSCGKIIHWKQGQAGHWPEIEGRTNSILFSEQGVNLQCGQCNIYKHGNPAGYNAFMEGTHGKKVMDKLRKLKRDTVIYDKEDYIRMMEKWLKKIEAMNIF